MSPTACADNNIFGTNDATVVWTDTSEHQESTNTGDRIQVLCPIDIKGDIGSHSGNISNGKITVNGPAVAVAGGTVSSQIVGDVVTLNSYDSTHLNDQKTKANTTIIKNKYILNFISFKILILVLLNIYFLIFCQ